MFAALLLTLAASDTSGITWISDDWERAKKEALQKKKLVAVDVWATWCHTCLSMKNFVLTEAPMARVKDSRVWLALDADQEANAAFFAKFPINAFPTFMVIDPATETIVGRWVGSGTAAEMASFFGGDDQRFLADAQRMIAAQNYAGARQLLEQQLAGKLAEPMRTRAVGALIEALWKLDPKLCAQEGVKLLQTEDTAPGLDVASMVAYCATELDLPLRKPILEQVAARLAPVAAQFPAGLTTDDKSNVLGTLIDIYDDLGQASLAQAALDQRVKLLEAAAKTATAEQRATFDYHRMDAYVRLGRLPEAEAMLKASEAAQPKDFNHPWRLAQVYLKQGRGAEALAAIDRALKNGYGGRKLRLYSTKLDILLLLKRSDDAKKVLAEARALQKRLHPNQVRQGWIDELNLRATKIEAKS